MATLIQSYEQQYSVLTADITAKIGRLKSSNEENREQLSREIQANFEEANDLLEQLELESRSAGGASRVAAYRAELQRVRDEYRSVVAANSTGYNVDTEEVYDEWSANEQRQKLLDNTERLERTGKNLSEGYRVAIEAEQTGAAVLQELSGQRETIQRARSRNLAERYRVTIEAGQSGAQCIKADHTASQVQVARDRRAADPVGAPDHAHGVARATGSVRARARVRGARVAHLHRPLFLCYLTDYTVTTRFQ
ncbi:unnamed protein product [Chilo suppressalis]|uniref:Vesicle transport v-SNARE N-terminal domain-containing protein n=1 Tax=Chilo suppressalis TaxID=168631 RepID=A0ABN8AWV5_CHISP|nr:unnamed protein product [Chilo suppressalis]